ncbi:hypothetical protein NEOC84_001906|uniref:tetratricopeptide repeat protein n=1 Tax=Neochlamydia sp. AcF84 TaxID=2315858 RepID=UPI0014099F6E|nr:tetratricopeptide repeat protein [Neochlamydia sp. AcF84]NGY95976.1 hypothetical protein [Neochlamydia sp. AcF84]
MNLESLHIYPIIFPAFEKPQKQSKHSARNSSVYAEIALRIFYELGLPDLCQAKLVCKEWKQLIEQTDGWKRLYSKDFKDNSPQPLSLTFDKTNHLPSSLCRWNQAPIANFLWYDPSTIISDSQEAKVNAATAYLKEEGFELKGVASDGDCFFSAFLGSYTCLSRKIPLLDDCKDKISYLRQVLADIVKHTDSERAEEIKRKSTWVSGLGEGDLLASALSIPIRLITVNEDHLICDIHDRLIFSEQGLSEENRSQEWKTIPQKERPKEYIFIVDLGGHFGYAQQHLKQPQSLLSKSKVPHSFFSYEDNSSYPPKKAKLTVKTRGIKRALTQNAHANESSKKRRLAPSSLTSLPLKIFKQVFLSFSTLNDNELKSILDARRCAKVFSKYMPSNSKFLTKYQPQKLPLYLDKLADWLGETIFPIGKDSNILINARLENAEEAYSQALKFAVQEKDFIQESFCIEKLGDIYLRKGTSETLLQAAGLYNYALRLAPQKRQKILKDRLSQVQNLLVKQYKGRPFDPMVGEKQFENNRCTLKIFREEIKEKMQLLPENPSPQEVRKLYAEMARQIKIFFGQLAIQIFDNLGPAPCEYAMIGFGSLAREEMTPYSDLEFGILIEEDTPVNREYFKGFTILLHLHVINLGETILPALNIPCLKSIIFFDGLTPRGFAFDGAGVEGKGCKTPLGNVKTFELIQTPEQMAQYIGKDEKGQWWHEKEPHLPMELLNFTHLKGDTELTKVYDKKIQELLNTSYHEGLTLRQYLAKYHLIQADMLAFNPGINDFERQGMLFKVKNDLYRFPHLALDRLALLEELKTSNTFERIDELKEQKTITHKAAEKLKEWMSIALIMRLKTYTYYQAQQEMMNPLIKAFGFDDPIFIKKQFALDKNSLKKIIKIYRIFIPFYKVIQQFLAGDEDSLKLSCLDDNSLEDRGNIALRLFQHKEAKGWFKLAIKENSQNTLALNGLGIIYQERGKLGKAVKYAKQALSTDRQLLGENHSTIARDYNNLAITYLLQKKLEQAAKYVEQALAIDCKPFGENYLTIATGYHNLGTIYQAQGNLKQAAKYAKQALAIDLRLLGKNHPKVATDYNNLGTLYQEQGNLELAANYARQSLAINLMLFGKNHPTVARDYNNLGQIYEEQGNLERAAEYTKQALDIDLKIFDENHPTVAIDYNNLAQIYQAQGNLGLAIEYAKRALDIDHKLFGENHSSVAIRYNTLGSIYKKQGILELAAKYTRQALDINLKLLGENHFTVATNYNNLGTIYQEQGDLEQAADYTQKALVIDLKCFGKNHTRVARDYNNLGAIYQEQGDLEQAADYTQKALVIDLKCYGKNHPTVALSYNNLAQIYQDQDKLENAAEFTKKALEITLKCSGKNYPPLASFYSNLGTIYQQQGNLEQAAKFIKKGLVIDLKLLGENHSTVANDYHNLGTIYQEQGDLGKAKGYIKKALAIDLKSLGENHPQVASDYNTLGAIYQEQGNLDKAKKYRIKALAIDNNPLGENHS